VPQELEIDKINAITRNLKEGDAEDKEFERRMRVAETLLKERQIEGKPNANGPRTTPAPAESQPRVSRDLSTPTVPRGPSGSTGNQGGGTV